MTTSIEIREVRPEEHETLGRLMVADYASLEGFPTPEEQPDDYQKLSYIGRLNDQPDTQVLVALSAPGQLVGGVVYFSDMAVYGSGGRATAEKDASGIRLLGVDPRYRQAGVGRALTEACIRKAAAWGHAHVILHTAQAMQVAWGLYRRMGFDRATDLDFIQAELPVFGFRLRLKRE